jgi:hypothetical protein
MLRMICSNLEAAYAPRPANAPKEAHPSMSVPALLGLDELGVEWIADYPKGVLWVNPKLRVKHAQYTGSQPGQAVGKALKHARFSTIFFNAHVDESAHVTVHEHDGMRTYGAYCLGTGGRLDDYGPPNGGREVSWQQSFGVLDYQTAGSCLYQLQHVMVWGGRCLFEGRYYDATESE